MAKLTRREAYRQRVFRVYSTIYDRSIKKRKITTRTLANIHHYSQTTIRNYIREMQRQKLPVEKQGRQWVYYNPEARLKEREGRVREERKELENEHNQLARKDYWLDDFEDFYRNDSRSSVAGKIDRAKWVNSETRDHIRRHLGL